MFVSLVDSDLKVRIILVLLLSSCSSLNKKFNVELVEVDPRSKECTYTIYVPNRLTDQSRIIALQLGSDAYAANTELTHSYFDQFSSEIIDNNVILEINQPGVFVESSAYKELIPLAFRSEEVKKRGQKRNEYFLNRYFQWKASEFAKCYVDSLEHLLARFGSRSIDLFGVSMGGDIMIRSLNIAQKKSPKVFKNIKRVFLVSSILETTRDILYRQSDEVNKRNLGNYDEVTESVFDPISGLVKKTVKKYPRQIIDKVKVYQTLLRLKDSDVDMKGFLPTEKQVQKLQLPYSSFTNMYLKSRIKEGASLEMLFSLLRKEANSIKVYAYHGKEDWNASPLPVYELEKESKKNKLIKTHFYPASHYLSGLRAFRKDMLLDFLSQEQAEHSHYLNTN